MLYNNRRASLSKQIMVQEADKHFVAFLRGEVGCILPSIYDLATRNQQLAVDLASEVYKIFCNKGFIGASDWGEKYYTLVSYGFLMCDLAFIFNPDNEKFELHTSSATLIKHLASRGSIEASTAKDAVEASVNKALSALMEDKKILTSLKKDNTVQTVRLDPSMYGRTLKFKLTVPRSQIDVAKSVVIPFTCYIEIIKKLQELFSKGLIRVTMNDGEKVRTVSLNTDVLNKVYSPDRINQLFGYVPNAYMRSFYVPSVGASTYSLGVTNIHPENIDKLEIVNLKDVDLSEVNVDFTMVRPYFIKQLDTLNLQQLKTIIKNLEIPVADKSTIASKVGCMATVESWVYKSQDPKAYESNLYKFMKESTFFDLSGLSQMVNIYGNVSVQENIPTNVNNLRVLLSTGVFRVTTAKRRGSMSTSIVTNNGKELKRILGDDYFLKYESQGVQLEYAKKLVVTLGKKFGIDAEIQNPVKVYSLLEEYGVFIPYDSRKTISTYSELYEFLRNTKKAFDETNKTVVQQSHLVVARNCQAWYDDIDDKKAYDYYKNIDVDNIVSITRLSYADSSKE